MITHIYLTRIVNDANKKYGFGMTEDSLNVYIPGKAIEDFGLEIDDVGSKEKVALMEDPSGKTSFIVLTFLDDDSRECAALRDEVDRLKDILDVEVISYA
jgi:hypothetical protein